MNRSAVRPLPPTFDDTSRPGLLQRLGRQPAPGPRLAAFAFLLLTLWLAMALLHGYYQLLHLAVDRAEQAQRLRAALQTRESHCEALANPHARGLCRLRARDIDAAEPTLARLDAVR
ncbi:hypothetical protein [Aquabacterium sp. J223]|uniref:hypothetical protein n=1 Tax=Aquabacterium sp. J223 TaxID=2898431 RepID=UPI0021ADF773|nr:hypothetical protein [Aquabacterium sp. J223]UUX95851.1 hypothetical protein LRS07_00395 [Aquabacterium sp. J223]